ncbi:hypothetical protein BU25DRAFT_403418 [Macroventuria anomochaeta]|uniref:Uncharacterized protein n=1 Tax=Macroventuria anomochaeta TaxID=301207 RepID=A0ACB6RLP5_9PLEO|nr:uncharacterized protein BU25DRAFT_403418 [Macroventuria anomochaeta]KAF2622079.1 hypothetical protein BU25DRAFT_403418 [Macroventuria anomochaeta]
MQSLRRTAVTAARTSRTTLSRQTRRYAHDEHAHGHAAPANEPLGKGFFWSTIWIPAGMGLYLISKNSESDRPFLTRLMDKYAEAEEKRTKKNDIHVRMIEQAGEDRVLFLKTKPQDHVDMRFPEIMNNGSPYNVPAGSQVPMTSVIEKYKKLANEDNERKLEALANDEIKGEQPFNKNHLRNAPSVKELRCWSFDADICVLPSAPRLPELNFRIVAQYSSGSDMNGTLGTKDDTHRTKAGAPMSYTSHRNFSGPLAVENPNMAAAPVSPVSPGNQWARPNPHSNPQSTPTNSKTSQYIDKITSDNDRLRRELRAEKLAREDEATRISAAKSKAEDSRAELQHLQVLAETNARAIERKDRKLEEMKATLDAEIQRRKAAEQRAEEALKMLGDTRSETQRQLATAYEMKHMADTQLETARDGFKRMTEGYEKKIKHISESMNELRQQRLEDVDKIKRQAVVSDQLHHEMSRTTRTEGALTNMMEEYKKEHRKEMDHIVQEAQRLKLALPAKEREADRLVQSLEETRDKMKWVITQQQRQHEQRPLEQRQQQQRQQGYR